MYDITTLRHIKKKTYKFSFCLLDNKTNENVCSFAGFNSMNSVKQSKIKKNLETFSVSNVILMPWFYVMFMVVRASELKDIRACSSVDK